jgi:trans-aconitate 2-methyltransferase
MIDIWNAKTYTKFLDLRTRPARDLLAVVPETFHPNIVYDLGCGPGNSTNLLRERWPLANIVGLDSSLDMLHEARTAYPDIEFIEGDIKNFSPSEKVDCVFANASLQWLDDHEVLIPKLLRELRVGGVFAMQMPNNFHAPAHQVSIHLLQDNVLWEPYLNQLHYGKLAKPLYQLSWYYDLLTKAGLSSLQLWETEYFQEMSDYQEIYDWVKGTALRPVMAIMNDENQKKFAEMYVHALAKEYPPQINNKIFLPFRRIFVVGVKN